MRKPRTNFDHLLILIAGMFFFSLSLNGQTFTAFSEVDYRGDWQSLPQEQVRVSGTQNLWFLDPISLRLGKVLGSGKVLSSDEQSFVLAPNSVWSNSKIKFTLDESPLASEDRNHPQLERKKVNLSRLPSGYISSLAEKEILLSFEITEIKELGLRFAGLLKFEAQSVPVTITVEGSSAKAARMPDIRDMRYGPHAKQLIDVYYPEGFDPRQDTPLPTIVNIHGGGWGAFHKNNLIGGLRPLEHGYAIASIAYRYTAEGKDPPGEMTPPVTAPFYDAARAVQHLRFHAEELGLDKERFGATGGSAGGCTSIWLALHDDLAEPESDDPISRESTRMRAAIPVQAQTSLDPRQITEWVPDMTYGSHAFYSGSEMPKDKAERMAAWLERAGEIEDWIDEFSPYEHASSDDPPMFFNNVGRKNVPEEDPTHHPKHSEMLAKRLQELGVKSWFWAENQESKEPRYNGHDRDIQFWNDHLKK